MNTTVKTILVWVLILVIAVGLYNFVERSNGRPVRTLSLTEFLASVEKGAVEQVTIQGRNVEGRLHSGNELFRASIPPDYTTIYDKLTASRVQVTVLPAEEPWLVVTSWVFPMVVAFGFGWLCSSWRGRSRSAPA